MYTAKPATVDQRIYRQVDKNHLKSSCKTLFIILEFKFHNKQRFLKMFGKKKAERVKPTRKTDRSGNLSQFGLFDMPTHLNFDGNVDQNINFNETDSDLEAELLALTGGSSSGKSSSSRRPNTSGVSQFESDTKENSTDDESVDENDPELLGELNEITGISDNTQQQTIVAVSSDTSNDIQKVLESRLEMYKTAEEIAKAAGETSRARRFNRGIKQLLELIKQAKLGKVIADEDIPPEVSTKPHSTVSNDSQPQPIRAAPPPPQSVIDPSSEIASQTLNIEPSPITTLPEEDSKNEVKSNNEELLNMLQSRKTEYKMAAVKAKKSGDNQNALNYIKVAKQFEIVIKAVEDGQEVDLSQMPGPPSPPEINVEHEKPQTGSDDIGEISVPDDIPEPTLISAGSLLDDLQQRLEVYQKQVEKAKEEGNSGKVRRMGRIVKQFEDAIKLHKNGKPIPIDELPTPPGYAPLNTGDSKAQEQPVVPTPSVSVTPKETNSGNKSKLLPTVRISGNHKTTTQADKQLAELLKRQKQFKLAALKAKQKGELAEAKEFLRTAKGFDPLIEAANGGLPVDFASLPLPPTEKAHLEDEVEVVLAEECTEDDQEALDVLRRLEQQLIKQIKMCIETRDHNKAIGDVAGANRFENLALSLTKDLDIIRLARRTASSGTSQIPKFHYETKEFSIVKTFTELNDNDLELTIVRGVNYSCSNPSDVDTYVKFEFPWPQEEPVKNRTSVVKNTNNPEYNATFWIPIQRKVRACQRMFKRQGVKLEVFSKGGLFRGDVLLGTVTVKLQPLETRCEIHDSFDLLDGRKKVGGKLEIRVRVRDPILTKEVEQTSERWLVIDRLS